GDAGAEQAEEGGLVGGHRRKGKQRKVGHTLRARERSVKRLLAWLAVLGLLPLSAAAQNVTYIHTDALGSPVLETNAQAQVVRQVDYRAYGMEIMDAPRPGPGYTGHYRDVGTGLVYMQQRYYDPGIGMFLSVDPMASDATTGWNFNRYNYAANNPYRFTDPDGRSIWTKLVKFVVKGGDIAATTHGLVEDFNTASDSSNSFPVRLGATLSMASEILPVSIGDIKDGAKAAGSVVQRLDDAADASRRSPDIDPRDVAGRTPSEIDGVARDAGLTPKGPDPMGGRGAYVDPVTGNQRVLIHPDASCGPHCHVNNPAGERLDINGQVVPLESPEAHLPLRLE